MPSEPAVGPGGRGRTATVLALGAGQTLAWASSYYLAAILADPMAAALGLSRSWIFGAFSLALLVSAALGPAVGRAIDARGGRGMLGASNLVFAAGLGLLSVVSGPVGLAAAWVVIGAGMAMGLYDAAFATLAGLYGTQARAPITGVTLMAGFASTIGWPLTVLLEAEFGWRGACLAWAALHIVVGLPLNRWLVPAAPAPQRTEAEAAAAAPAAASRRTLGLLGFVFAVGWFVSTAMAAHLPAVLQAGGVSLGAAVAAGALVGPAQVAARLVEFGLLQRAHPLVAARLATVLHPLGAVLLVLFGAPAALFAVLHGAGNGLLTIAVGTLPLALFGAAGYGLRQGVLAVPARIAQAAAPLLFGLVVDRLGSAALAVSSGLLLAAFVALALIRRTLARPR